MTEYKLFNTDGKTFFDFRSNPNSRMEAFTVSYLDDGTVVMSGDYGCLCWKRYQSEKDYGFPGKETGIGYFAEKVCDFGVEQKITEFNKQRFISNLAEHYNGHENWQKFLDEVEWKEDNDEYSIRTLANDYLPDAWECSSDIYTTQFEFLFEILKSISQQILDKVNEQYKYIFVCPDQLSQEKSLLFWKPESKGYTSDIEEAGLYTKEEAEQNKGVIAIQKYKILEKHKPKKIIWTSIEEIKQLKGE